MNKQKAMLYAFSLIYPEHDFQGRSDLELDDSHDKWLLWKALAEKGCIMWFDNLSGIWYVEKGGEVIGHGETPEDAMLAACEVLSEHLD